MLLRFIECIRRIMEVTRCHMSRGLCIFPHDIRDDMSIACPYPTRTQVLDIISDAQTPHTGGTARVQSESSGIKIHQDLK